MKTIYSHKGYVYCLNILRDGRLASCSDDKSIKIYNKNTFNCEITILGHTDDVFYFVEMKDGFLISCSGSLDKSIRIWSISGNSYKSEYIIENAHEYFIMKVIILSKNRFGSCSNDKTIKIWNSNPPYNLIKVLTGHQLSVDSIIKLKKRELLVSGSYDKTLRFWNLNSYQCETIMNDISCYNNDSLFEYNKNILLIGGENTIKIADLQQFKIIQTLKDCRLGDIYSLIKVEDYVLFGCQNGVLGIYNLKNNKIKIQEHSHSDDIICLKYIKDESFCSGSHDNSIKIWKLNNNLMN